jgi:hypothetical protein
VWGVIEFCNQSWVLLAPGGEFAFVSFCDVINHMSSELDFLPSGYNDSLVIFFIVSYAELSMIRSYIFPGTSKTFGNQGSNTHF